MQGWDAPDDFVTDGFGPTALGGRHCEYAKAKAQWAEPRETKIIKSQEPFGGLLLHIPHKELSHL